MIFQYLIFLSIFVFNNSSRGVNNFTKGNILKLPICTFVNTYHELKDVSFTFLIKNLFFTLYKKKEIRIIPKSGRTSNMGVCSPGDCGVSSDAAP